MPFYTLKIVECGYKSKIELFVDVTQVRKPQKTIEKPSQNFNWLNLPSFAKLEKTYVMLNCLRTIDSSSELNLVCL